VGERVLLGRLHQDVGRRVGVLALEDLLAPVDRLDGLAAGLGVDEARERIHHLVAHLLEVGRVDDPVGLAPGEVDRDALARRADRRERPGLGPVHRLRQRDLPVQAEEVVDRARDLAHRPPLHRPEDDVRRAELEESELLQELVHLDRARDRLEPARE
jgi:hypothetical protein